MAFGHFGNEQYIVASGISSFTPPNLPTLGLLAHYDNSAASMITDGSAWNDISGNSRNFSQGVSADRPTYLATGFNGEPTFNFTGNGTANEFFLDTSGDFMGYSGGDEATLIFVAKVNSIPTEDSVPWRIDTGGGGSVSTFRIDDTAGGRVSGQMGNGSAVAHFDTPVFDMIYISVADIDASLPDTSFEMRTRVNGGAPGGGANISSPISTWPADTQVWIGSFGNNTDPFEHTEDISISEIACYDRVLTIAEINSVQSFLANKYSITVSTWLTYDT
jgi:hypothetical protein